MQKITLALSVAFVFVCTMAVAPHAAPADRRIGLSVEKNGAPLGGVEVALHAANQGKVDLGVTASDGSLDFAISAANIGKVSVDVVVEECPDGIRVHLIAPRGQLPPEQDKCTRHVIGAFRWDRVSRVVINVAGDLTVTDAGMSAAMKFGLIGGGAAAAVAVAAGGGGGSSTTSTVAPPVAATPPPATPPMPPPTPTNIEGPFLYTFGPPSFSCTGNATVIMKTVTITVNADGSITFDVQGTIFTGRRIDDTTIEVTVEGTFLGFPWLADGTRGRWVKRLSFSAGGNQFTVQRGEITPLSGSCLNTITHPGQATRQ